MIFGLLVVLADRLLKGVTLRTFSAATFGLLLGLFFSWLLLASDILRYASDDVQWLAGLAVYTTFGYLGMMLAVRSGKDEFSLIIPYVRFRQSAVQDLPLIVDSNILIDGRLEAASEDRFHRHGAGHSRVSCWMSCRCWRIRVTPCGASGAGGH